VQFWLDLANTHYRALDAVPVPIPALNRDDADDADLAARFAGCGLVYLSGGNPGYLAETLRGTKVWAAIVAAVAAGAALAGCSAGAMAMSALAPHVGDGIRSFQPGLGVLEHVAVIPHFDRIQGWVPGIVEQYLDRLPDGTTLIGIDEDTALVGGPDVWTVMGRANVHVFDAGGGTSLHAAGARVSVTR
jgi:cyanophycinase